jgi:hypothetical protein
MGGDEVQASELLLRLAPYPSSGWTTLRVAQQLAESGRPIQAMDWLGMEVPSKAFGRLSASQRANTLLILSQSLTWIGQTGRATEAKQQAAKLLPPSADDLNMLEWVRSKLALGDTNAAQGRLEGYALRSSDTDSHVEDTIQTLARAGLSKKAGQLVDGRRKSDDRAKARFAWARGLAMAGDFPQAQAVALGLPANFYKLDDLYLDMVFLQSLHGDLAGAQATAQNPRAGRHESAARTRLVLGRAIAGDSTNVLNLLCAANSPAITDEATLKFLGLFLGRLQNPQAIECALKSVKDRNLAGILAMGLADAEIEARHAAAGRIYFPRCHPPYWTNLALE